MKKLLGILVLGLLFYNVGLAEEKCETSNPEIIIDLGGDSKPEKIVYMRDTICEGSWTLEKMGPKKTRLRYWVHTHPGGSIPNWIVNKANSVSLPTLFSAIENRANDPSWKRD